MQNMNGFFEIDIKNLLEFFDEKPITSQRHATSLTQMFGEDLGAALFNHYLNSRGIESRVISNKCTTGKKSGPRLDRWILTNENGYRVLYQTEIKNWSAHAIGGSIIRTMASSDELSEYGKKEWSNIWDSEKSNFKWPTLSKVLFEMKEPTNIEYDEKRPLLIYWIPLCYMERSSPFFNVQVKSNIFDRLWVFSMSSYLRSINTDKIVVKNMPNFANRLLWINSIFKSIDDRLPPDNRP
ncbi:MAG: hypothetical protein RIG61_04580 [Deltaproteobacteria bacterium]